MITNNSIPCTKTPIFRPCPVQGLFSISRKSSLAWRIAVRVRHWRQSPNEGLNNLTKLVRESKPFPSLPPYRCFDPPQNNSPKSFYCIWRLLGHVVGNIPIMPLSISFRYSIAGAVSTWLKSFPPYLWSRRLAARISVVRAAFAPSATFSAYSAGEPAHTFVCFIEDCPALSFSVLAAHLSKCFCIRSGFDTRPRLQKSHFARVTPSMVILPNSALSASNLKICNKQKSGITYKPKQTAENRYQVLNIYIANKLFICLLNNIAALPQNSHFRLFCLSQKLSIRFERIFFQ